MSGERILIAKVGLDDWTPTGEAEWSVQDGAIVAEGDGRGLLLTVDQYENFEMTVEWLLVGLHL